MSFLDALIPGSRRHRMFVQSLDALEVNTPNIVAETLTLDGVPITGVFAPPPSDRNLTSGFFTGSIPVTFKVVGTANQFHVTTREFNIPPSIRTSATQDYLYVNVPHLLNYNLSGIIPYSTNENLPDFQIAVCWKLAGIEEMYICPTGSPGGFNPVTYTGQTLFFSPGHITGTLY